MKTYDWINATANSNIINPMNNHIIINNNGKLLITLLPNNVISKCPAIMFAVNRTAKDPGRIKFLMDSINTIKGIRIEGVPIGTKWVNILFVLLIHPNIIRDIQIDKANVRDTTKWAVAVKT